MATTRVTRAIRATPAAVYRAIVDPLAVQTWMVPDGMTSSVERFEAEVGGAFRISLTYDEPTSAGKTDAQTDTFEGRFVELDPGRRVVQVVAFETDDPSTQGEMTITYTLRSTDGGTELVGLHENLPPGVSPEDNELGWSMSFDKLASLVERGDGT
jgi:uncharacterized protein YndB with AHSA1/START domain